MHEAWVGRPGGGGSGGGGGDQKKQLLHRKWRRQVGIDYKSEITNLCTVSVLLQEIHPVVSVIHQVSILTPTGIGFASSPGGMEAEAVPRTRRITRVSGPPLSLRLPCHHVAISPRTVDRLFLKSSSPRIQNGFCLWPNREWRDVSWRDPDPCASCALPHSGIVRPHTGHTLLNVYGAPYFQGETYPIRVPWNIIDARRGHICRDRCRRLLECTNTWKMAWVTSIAVKYIGLPNISIIVLSTSRMGQVSATQHLFTPAPKLVQNRLDMSGFMTYRVRCPYFAHLPFCTTGTWSGGGGWFRHNIDVLP